MSTTRPRYGLFTADSDQPIKIYDNYWYAQDAAAAHQRQTGIRPIVCQGSDLGFGIKWYPISE